jgi:amino acid transporter
MVFVLLAFGGWSEIATLSAEVKDARHGMARAHVASIALITFLYLLVNWAFLRGLGFDGLARSSAPAAELMTRAFGASASLLLALAVALAAITSINATILVGARTTYAAARDFAALGSLGRWDERRGVPRMGVWAQGAMSLALVGLGATTRNGFATLVDYTAPAFWIFMTLSSLGLVVLRYKHPRAPRPFRTPLYPLPPLVFSAANVFMLWSSVTYVASLPERRLGVISGAVVTLLGVALIAFVEGRARRP